MTNGTKENSNSSPKKSSYLSVLPSLAGRSGGVGMLAITNASSHSGKFVSCYMRCDIGDGLGDDPPMLFAVPLDFSPVDRTIFPGVNIFDVFIQGYNYGRNPTADLRRHVEYIFHMINVRTSEYVESLHGNQRSDFVKASSNLFNSIVDMRKYDLLTPPAFYQELDKIFSFTLRVKIISAQGDYIKQRIKLDTLGMAQWLANYLNGTERNIIEKKKINRM